MTRVAGTVRVPGDKSLSHRALMLAALGDGESRIRNVLESADVHSTAGVLRALGVPIPPLSSDMRVRGVGLRGLQAPAADLDCGNSGTTTRLVAGIVAGAGLTARFVGDASLSRRPMQRIAAPLKSMGARVELAPHGGLPMVVTGGQLQAVEWRSEVASAQIKSAVLLAALMAGREAVVVEPERSRDHTERMLAARGVTVRVEGTRVAMSAASRLAPCDAAVPGDPSSAAFFAALGALATSGGITLPGVGVNPTRTGFFETLRRMGARVSQADAGEEGGEPTATLVIGPSVLRGVAVGGAEIPSMIDELPLLACIAARAHGETVITGAGELRVKESDRISAVVANLRALRVDAEELPDGMRIAGSDRRLEGRIETHGDHRLAMAFAVLGAVGKNVVEIDDRACVSVSYPGFWDDLDRVVNR